MYVIFPPRPKGVIPPDQLPRLERQGHWLAQRKFGGHRTLLHVSKSGTVTLFSRYGRRHPPDLDVLDPDLRSQVSALNFKAGDEYWLDGELLHRRVDRTVVFFDVLHAGQYLFGVSQGDRLALLRDICGDPTEAGDPAVALRVTPNVWMAETWDRGFAARYADFLHLGHLIEGLVLRDARSYLDNWGVREYEVNWQIRCRKPSKSYVH